MAKGKDPAFLFYPGDYLRDTQCLNEKCQVAYDRIMCEHMRNTGVSKKQVNFFIKRLSEDEKEDIMSILIEDGDNFYIEWVKISIEKRRAYSESRKNNRAGKTKKHMKDICVTYDPHMEDANENEDVKEEDNDNNKNKKDSPPIPKPFAGNWDFKNALDGYIEMRENKKKQPTARAMKLIFGKLERYSNGVVSIAVEILEKSTISCWTDVFPLKGKREESEPDNMDDFTLKNLPQEAQDILKNVGV